MGDDVVEGNGGSRPVAPAAARPRSGLRALVIEDETKLAGLLGSYLERDGFDVAVVHDGLDAITTARALDPDVVVLDLGLPSLDGVEVCRQLRTFSDAYVVMLTARSEEVDTLIGLSVGADDCAGAVVLLLRRRRVGRPLALLPLYMSRWRPSLLVAATGPPPTLAFTVIRC